MIGEQNSREVKFPVFPDLPEAGIEVTKHNQEGRGNLHV
jgi:hypothetical protein